MSDENRQAYAEQLAYSRLTGTLFAPANLPGFNWTPQAFVEALSEEKLAAFPPGWEATLEDYVNQVVEEQFGGERELLNNATASERLLCGINSLTKSTLRCHHDKLVLL